jgi:hypothetical protein
MSSHAIAIERLEREVGEIFKQYDSLVADELDEPRASNRDVMRATHELLCLKLARLAEHKAQAKIEAAG